MSVQPAIDGTIAPRTSWPCPRIPSLRTQAHVRRAGPQVGMHPRQPTRPTSSGTTSRAPFSRDETDHAISLRDGCSQDVRDAALGRGVATPSPPPSRHRPSPCFSFRAFLAIGIVRVSHIPSPLACLAIRHVPAAHRCRAGAFPLRIPSRPSLRPRRNVVFGSGPSVSKGME